MRPDDPTLETPLLHEFLPEKFLIKDVQMSDQKRHVVFATPKQIKLLAKAKVWYMDGTFKVIKDPFKQLYSIHSFIRSGESMKQVPLCFVIMSRQKTKDYTEVLEAILDEIKKICPEGNYIVLIH